MTETLVCPTCGAPGNPGDRFCEIDGTPLIPSRQSSVAGRSDAPNEPLMTDDTQPATGCVCGLNQDDGDGYCVGCGHRLHADAPPARMPLPNDHIEDAPDDLLAAVTDRGVRHAENQDSFALSLQMIGDVRVPVIVVCDGVSSARHSAIAAAVGARTCHDALVESFVVRRPSSVISEGSSGISRQSPIIREQSSGIGDALPAPLTTDGGRRTTAQAMRAAILAAHEAICALDDAPGTSDLGPPGATIVAAVALPDRFLLGWVGDSRAYRVSNGASRALTRDDSWMEDALARGESAAEAIHSPYAHAITHCLGPLEEGTPEPNITEAPRTSGGMLLLCTDGFWNYAPDATLVAKLVQGLSRPDATALDHCRALVAHALAGGGHDNVTVAIAVLDAPHDAGAETIPAVAASIPEGHNERGAGDEPAPPSEETSDDVHD